jgi:signal transduction histidine kinase
MQLKLYNRAAVSLKKAQHLAEKAGVASELTENYFRFARLDSALGNMTEAYVWMKKYTALKEKIFNSEKSGQITQMQAAFDAERKDRTIEMLAKEKDYQQSEKVTQRLIFVAGVIVLLIILAGLLYFLRQKHKTNRILNEQKNHSEKLNQLKDKLFSIIAHDLKGPLHSLKALLNLATSNNISEAELKYLLGTIGHNTQYTTDLVDNLLMWAKDNLQGSSITPQAFDLTALVQNNIQLLNPQAEKKGIKIQYTMERSVGAYADRNMIDLVLRNILSNAIKFTPDSGIVTVSVGREHSDTTVSIKDTGLGIRKELHGKLFSNQNYSTPGTANEKGTGLGLILCKEFVEKNDGKISVKSAEGSGSTFTFTIPSAVMKELDDDVASPALACA